MKPSGIFLVILIALITGLGGCVSQAEFDEYKAAQEELRQQMETRMDSADVVDATLACETRMDAYQEATGSDEPLGTRRDEGLGTRRDYCLGDPDNPADEGAFVRIFGPLISECRDEMQACINQGTQPDVCNECFRSCYENGTWPNTPECAITP